MAGKSLYNIRKRGDSSKWLVYSGGAMANHQWTNDRNKATSFGIEDVRETADFFGGVPISVAQDATSVDSDNHVVGGRGLSGW